jgi:type IV secretory pathway TrbD component
MDTEVQRTLIHQALTRPVLLGGAERRLAILNWLIVAALIFGVGLHLYTILGTAGHWALRQAAKFDAQLSEIYIRHLHYQRYYPPRAAITAPPAPVHPAVPRLRKY